MRTTLVLAAVASLGWSCRCTADDAEVRRLLDRDAATDTVWSVGFDRLEGELDRGSASVSEGVLRVETEASPDPRLVVGQIRLRAPRDLPIDRFRYLTVRARALDGAVYYIRPLGRDRLGRDVPLWHETALTDDRLSSAWETVTFGLPRLAEECGGEAVSLWAIDVACADMGGRRVAVELDFLAAHGGLVPEAPVASESDFTNHLDDDGDGLTDSEDDQFATARPRWVLAYYHPWFGAPSGPARRWSGWSNRRILSAGLDTPSAPDPEATLHDPDHIVPGTRGKRDIAAPWYPLDPARFPDYVPEVPLDYARFGGVDRYDCADPAFVADQIRCAKRFGITGFVVDTGGIGSYEDQLAAVIAAAEQVGGFSVSAVYDWYYRCPNYLLFDAKSPEGMARDLRFLRRRFADSPAWLRLGGRPVLFATFLSDHGVSLEHWRRAVALSASPGGPPVDGSLGAEPGATIDVALQFDGHVALPPGEARPLTKPFSRVAFLDASFREVGAVDVGTPQARPALVSGWSLDEGSGDGTYVWAASDDARSVVRLTLPQGASYVAFSGPQFVADPTRYDVLVGGEVRAEGLGAGGGTHSCILAVGERPPSAPLSERDRDYALILDSPTYGAAFDGWATYGESASGRGCLVSPVPSLVSATAMPGYDDRVVRNPGNVVERDEGSRFRESLERALAADPAFLSICTWSEWGEGTVVEPTVEFGYRYLELVLTYSLLHRGLLSLEGTASASGLTVARYDPEETDGVRVSCEAPVRVTFAELHGPWKVERGGQGTTVQAGPEGLSLDLEPGTSALRR